MSREGLDAIPVGHEAVAQLVSLLQQEAEDCLRAVVVFGSAVSGPFDADSDVIRSVVVLDRMALDFVRRLSLHGATLGKQGIAAPLVMTADYIRNSCDTFPLELLDIQQHHILAYGTHNDFAALSFDNSDIRLQCERDLKVVLMGLRQGLLAAAGRDHVLDAVEVDAAAGLLRTLRGLLWISGKHERLPDLATVSAVETLVGRSLDGLRTALNRGAYHGWDELQALYGDVEALGNHVDAL